MKNIGLLITVSFAILLVKICFGGLIMLPVIAITFAKLFSLDGVLGGDPANLPSYFTVLMIISGTLCTALLCGIDTWKLLVLKHVHVRIHSKEQEKILVKQQKKQ